METIYGKSFNKTLILLGKSSKLLYWKVIFIGKYIKFINKKINNRLSHKSLILELYIKIYYVIHINK